MVVEGDYNFISVTCEECSQHHIFYLGFSIVSSRNTGPISMTFTGTLWRRHLPPPPLPPSPPFAFPGHENPLSQPLYTNQMTFPSLSLIRFHNDVFPISFIFFDICAAQPISRKCYIYLLLRQTCEILGEKLQVRRPVVAYLNIVYWMNIWVSFPYVKVPMQQNFD